MAKGVWRRSGEEFSAYCYRQIAAHTEEIERCETLAQQRACDGYHGTALFYNNKANRERSARMKWKREFATALLSEGQRDKNSSDPTERTLARIKLHQANGNYGKFSPFYNPEIPESVTADACQILLSSAYSRMNDPLDPLADLIRRTK